MNKIGAIQSLRAIAAWTVVLHHVHQIFFDFAVDSLPGWLVATKGSVGVDLFFVISGFVMVISTRVDKTTAGEFLMRRLARIAPAYWVATLIFSAVLLMFPALIRDPFRLDWEHLLLSLFFISSFQSEHFFPVLTVGWSLNFEMLFYALLALGIASYRRTRLLHLDRWVVAVAILALVFAYPWRFPGVAVFKSKMLLMFLMGYGLGIAYLTGRLPLRRIPGLVLLGLGVGLIVATERNFFVLRGIACTCIVWGGLCFESSLARLRTLSRLGDWSYSTYLLHLIVLMLAHEVSIALGGGMETAFILVSLVVILVLSGLAFRYIERPAVSLFLPRPAAGRV